MENVLFEARSKTGEHICAFRTKRAATKAAKANEGFVVKLTYLVPGEKPVEEKIETR